MHILGFLVNLTKVNGQVYVFSKKQLHPAWSLLRKRGKMHIFLIKSIERSQLCRDAARFSNPGGKAVMWWAKSAPLVIIGLTELPNSRWALAHPAHLLAAPLTDYDQIDQKTKRPELDISFKSALSADFVLKLFGKCKHARSVTAL